MAWVWFDYGNVISHPQPEADVAAMARAARCTVAELSAGYWSYREEYDRAVLDGPAFWRKVGATVGRSYSAGTVAELIRLDNASWLHLREESIALIEEVVAGGHRLALLSNAPCETAEVISALPVAARFEHLAFSCYLKAAKPDPDVFHTVLSQTRARAAEVVFLDDRQENVTAAAAIGIRTVHFTSPAQARAALAAHRVTLP